MLWVPRVDEVPMSLSTIGPNLLCGVTIELVGEATKAIHDLRKGDQLGVRGPFGNGFTLTKGKVLLVAGGMGLAPILPLAERLRVLGTEVVLVYGVKTKVALFGLNRAKTTVGDAGLLISTEDGTAGTKGLTTTLVAPMLEEEHFSMVYCCGPEPMMRALFELAEQKQIPIQACMERIVKCSIGLCGSCMIGRYRICKDGLVLSSEQLREVLDEFGRYNRAFDGRREYYTLC